jgi:deazaflavin-dependent oxidoreductase (nitroreductase family)
MNPLLGLVLATHVLLYRATNGLLGGRLAGMKALLLTTRGRRSGRERTIPLTYYEDDGTPVLIASFGGAARHPAWFLNLRASPVVMVQRGAERLRMHAEIADAGTRARLWPQITRAHPQYAGYQRRTSREIPLVLLRRQPPAGSGT